MATSRDDRFLRAFVSIAIGCLISLYSSIGAYAQLEFSVSPSPVGSGARAAGMADAFVAIADDATAASWNPAGLVQLELPELSIVGSYNTLSEEFHSDSIPGLNSSQSSDSLDLNFMSIVYPLPVTLGSSNATFSLSYQQKYDFTRFFDVELTSMSVIGETPVNSTTTVNFDQTGSFSTITPSFAIEINERLSVGVSVNFWRSSFLSDNGWSKTVESRAETVIGDGIPLITDQSTQEQYTDLKGENYNFGVLWQATDKMTIGLRYETAFTADVNFQGVLNRNGTELISIVEKREVHFPDTLALGASYRFNDRLTVSMDVSRTNWNDFYVKRASGTRFSLIDGMELGDPDTAADFETSYTVRLGAEYVLIPRDIDAKLDYLWSLRGGLFFDQEPASGRSITSDDLRGDGEPDDFYGFALGVGLMAFQRFNFDAAYQLRYGNNVNSDFIGGVRHFDEDFMQHRLLFSTVIYF